MTTIVRLKDIAELAGVSVTTVSRVLNHTASEVGISQKTQKRVMKIARELNYQPNKEARNLRLGRRPQSILFLSLYEGRTAGAEGFLSHPFFGELMHGIQAEVSKRGCYLSYVAVSKDNMCSITDLIQDRVSGVITWGTIPPTLLKILRHSRLPVAAIEPYNTGIEDIHEIYVDNDQAVFLAMNHLYESGYGKVIMADTRLKGEKQNPVFSERVTAFKKYKNRYEDIATSLETYHRDRGISDIYAGEILGKRIIDNMSGSTGIVAVNDLTAIGILNTAQKMRVKIPEELGVVGIDDIEWARFHSPALTTVRIPKRQFAIEAMSYLSQYLKGNPQEPHVIRVPVGLVERETTKGGMFG